MGKFGSHQLSQELLRLFGMQMIARLYRGRHRKETGGMISFALLAGGDYDDAMQGVTNVVLFFPMVWPLPGTTARFNVVTSRTSILFYDNERDKMSMPYLAAFREDKFTEWGTRSMIIKRFRDLIWEAAVICVLRRAALEADDRDRSKRRASGNEDRHIPESLQPSCTETVRTSATLVN
ncbi:hypothetical protein IW262DRAFT_1300721 [Armillaria fumosa]|nr:hypothetical protein IW262DRAFT_1300721 [Armillaria fumosa]